MTVSSLPPGLILIAAGLLLPLAGPRMRQGLIVGAPLLALWWVWQIPDGVHLRLHLLDLAWIFPGADLKPGVFDLELVRGDRLARLFGTVFRRHGLRRRPVRPAAEPDDGAVGRLLLCRRGAGRRLCRRHYLGLHLLGDHGDRLDAGDLVGGDGRRPRRRPALRGDPPARRRDPDGGHRRLHHRHTVHRLRRQGDPEHPRLRPSGHLADPGRLPDQRRRAALLGLAARRLSGNLVERHGLPVGLHDQGRGARADPRLSGHGTAGLGRPLHDLLRDHLCAAGKRYAAHPGLFDRQPGRIHGLRRRPRRQRRSGIQPARAERRRVPRLHPHHLQSAAADVGRLGPLHDGQAEMHRSGRPVPHHAAHDDLRHHRRPVDFQLPLHFRLHLEVDDFLGRGGTASALGLACPDGGLGRRVPPCRHQVSRGSSSSRRTAACARRTHPGACAGR